MSVRDSLNKKPITQAEVDALMANEPDVLPAYGGAGSMATHLKRAKRQYTPTDARARLTAGERAQFVAENQEVIYTSPEERAQIEAKLADVLNRDKVKTLFANAVRKNQPIEDLWSKAGGEGEILAGFERDGDPTGAPEPQILAAWKTFAESPIFAAYYTTDAQSPRGKVLGKVIDLLWNFMMVNLINMSLAQSWAKSFGMLSGIGVLPASVPSIEQAERNKPADDGNPVAMNDVTGEPVTYKFKDGRVVRYSKQMLDQLNSESYAKLLGIRKSPVELHETEEQKRQRKAHEYRTTIVAGGYTQKELDAMDSEKYREVMQLSRAPMAMKPFDSL